LSDVRSSHRLVVRLSFTSRSGLSTFPKFQPPRILASFAGTAPGYLPLARGVPERNIPAGAKFPTGSTDSDLLSLVTESGLSFFFLKTAGGKNWVHSRTILLPGSKKRKDWGKTTIWSCRSAAGPFEIRPNFARENRRTLASWWGVGRSHRKFPLLCAAAKKNVFWTFFLYPEIALETAFLAFFGPVRSIHVKTCPPVNAPAEIPNET